MGTAVGVDMSCVPGRNMSIGITHKKDDLARLARKMTKKPNDNLLKEIKRLKNDIIENKSLYQEHLGWCEYCSK